MILKCTANTKILSHQLWNHQAWGERVGWANSLDFQWTLAMTTKNLYKTNLLQNNFGYFKFQPIQNYVSTTFPLIHFPQWKIVKNAHFQFLSQNWNLTLFKLFLAVWGLQEAYREIHRLSGPSRRLLLTVGKSPFAQKQCNPRDHQWLPSVIKLPESMRFVSLRKIYHVGTRNIF